MRTWNAVKNSIYALSSFFLIAIMGIVVRKIFVQHIPIELLGLEGLFSNIISILSLAECGISNIITYHLYENLAKNKKQKINFLMNVYRKSYLYIGIFIFLASLCLFPFLHVLVKTDLDWHYVQFVFVLQIISLLMSYFLAYYRTLLIADQRNFVCAQIDVKCSIVNNVCKIFILIITESYVLYALSNLFFNILSNILVYKKAKHDYPFLSYCKTTIKDMKTMNFFADIKDFIAHKLESVVFGSTDMLIATTMLGLHVAGCMANYLTIFNAFNQVVSKSLQSIIPSLGNLIHQENQERVVQTYSMLDMIYYLFAIIMSGLILVSTQSLITLLFGTQFLLPDEYVIVIALSTFFSIYLDNAHNFRLVHGRFDFDRNWVLLSIIVNVVFSIACTYFFGIIGIVIRRILGFLLVAYGRIQFVFRLILKKEAKSYYKEICCKTMLAILELFFINMIPSPQSAILLILTCMIIALLLFIINACLFWNDKSFQCGKNHFIMIAKKVLA